MGVPGGPTKLHRVRSVHVASARINGTLPYIYLYILALAPSRFVRSIQHVSITNSITNSITISMTNSIANSIKVLACGYAKR